jgi:hypothetical protein
MEVALAEKNSMRKNRMKEACRGDAAIEGWKLATGTACIS